MSWTVFTMADAYMERPPVVCAVDNFFEFPSLNIVYGAPSSLKSMIVMDMAFCVATGRPWLTNLDGITPKDTTQANVLWVDFDNGKRTTSDRVRAIGHHYQVPAEDRSFRYVTCPIERLDMSNWDSVFNLEEAIKEAQAKLLIVDNLGLVTGGTDENSNGMVQIMGNFRTLAERHKMAVVVIHHERKGSSTYAGRQGDTLRGHSSIEGSLDRSFVVTREERSNKITITPVKQRGASIDPFCAYFRHRNNGAELQEAWFEGVSVDSQKVDAEKAVLSTLKHGEKKQGDVVEEIRVASGMSKGKAREIIKSLLERKFIVERKGEKNASLYSLADPNQLVLPKNKDIVAYDQQIEPSHGYTH